MAGQENGNGNTPGNTQPTTAKRTVSPWTIFLLAGIALVAIGWTSIYIFKEDKYHTLRFHEIYWSPKDVTNQLIEKAMADTADPAKLDTAEAFKAQRKQHIDELKKIKKLLASRTDTAFRKKFFDHPEPSLFIHTTDFAIGDYDYNKKDRNDSVPITPKVYVTFADSFLVNGQVSASVQLYIKRVTPARFFNKYPGFGLWSLLLMIQAALYFLLIAGLIYHFISPNSNKLFKDHLGYKRRSTVIVIIAMILFVLAVYFLLFFSKTPDITPGKIFMRTLPNIFALVNAAGYLCAALCLAGMITSVINMYTLKENSASIDAAMVQTLRKEIKNRFNIYFIFTAIILSLAIFTTGVFFSSMNSMEFIKQVTRDQGYSPVNSDMVYLYGILNSFILIIAYLPSRFLISLFDKSIPSPKTQDVTGAKEEQNEPDKKTLTGGLSKMMKNVTDVLVATSPFIASLLQNLLDYIFN